MDGTKRIICYSFVKSSNQYIRILGVGFGHAAQCKFLSPFFKFLSIAGAATGVIKSDTFFHTCREVQRLASSNLILSFI